MDTSVAAQECRQFISKIAKLPSDDPAETKDHLHFMIDQIASGQVSGEKSHRWLGYLQGIIVAGGGATLEEMKKTNVLA